MLLSLLPSKLHVVWNYARVPTLWEKGKNTNFDCTKASGILQVLTS